MSTQTIIAAILGPIFCMCVGAYLAYKWIIYKLDMKSLLLEKLADMPKSQLVNLGVWCPVCQEALSLRNKKK